MSRKSVAAALAKTIAEDRRAAMDDAFANFRLNPNEANFLNAQEKARDFMSARNIQHDIAEWEEDS